MHEAQVKEATDKEVDKKARQQRPFKFFVLVKHRQIDLETNQPKAAEVMEFGDKAEMRAKLETAEYETAEIRVLRGYELTVKAKRNFSIN